MNSRRTRGDRHSSRVEAKNPALLSSRDGYLLAQPNINIKINGKRFSGLLNTGSNINITIISKHLWPTSWPIQKISCQIAGISQIKVQEVHQSVQIYPCEGPEGQTATLKPYVIDAHLNPTGRDLLMKWQTQIYVPRFS